MTTPGNTFERTLGTAAILLVDYGPAGRQVTIQNIDSTNDAYVGIGSLLSGTAGLKVIHAYGNTVTITLGDNDQLYGIAGTGTPIVVVSVPGVG